MKLFAAVALAFLAIAGTLLAQPSPPRTATGTINGKTITIKYAAPSVRGRKIFGEGGRISQDPTYPIWRAGANSATALQTDADLKISGLNVPKGDYTLFVNVENPDAWELIINKQTGQWGLSYNQGQDLGRVKMQMSKPPAPVEQLKYTITDLGGNKGRLTLEWENHVASVPVTVQ